MKIKIFITLIALAIMLLITYMFLGIEITYKEDDTEYSVFVKKKFSTDFLFTNTALCGECDLRPLNFMSKEDVSRFASYCSAKYGEKNIQNCHKFFEHQDELK